MRIRSKTYETHGLQDPARFIQGTSRVSYTYAHQKTNSSLLLAVKSFKAGWQPGLPSSLLPPPYATGPPKRRALLQTGSFVCYTVACARNTHIVVGETVIQRQFSCRVHRTHCISETVTSRARIIESYTAPPF